jgi:hypothetical protein
MYESYRESMMEKAMELILNEELVAKPELFMKKLA